VAPNPEHAQTQAHQRQGARSGHGLGTGTTTEDVALTCHDPTVNKREGEEVGVAFGFASKCHVELEIARD
jgi:hypothetical protein